MRVCGVEYTANIHIARQLLKKTTANGLSNLNEAVAKFRNGEVDVVASGKEF